jgi:uncharacterized protein YegJ (DUF2314 family)
MTILVDAYNVLHVVGVLPPELAGIDVPGLADLIATSRYRGRAVLLVCDGRPAPGARDRIGRVAVAYAGPSFAADDVIAAMIARSPAPRRLTVVSSDRAIARAARRRRCRVLASPRFLAQLARDRRAAGRARRHAPPPERNLLRTAARPQDALPPEILAEAERLVAESGRPEPSPEPTVATTRTAPSRAGGPAPAPGARDGERPPVDDAFPPEVIAEADRIWRSAMEMSASLGLALLLFLSGCSPAGESRGDSGGEPGASGSSPPAAAPGDPALGWRQIDGSSVVAIEEAGADGPGTELASAVAEARRTAPAARVRFLASGAEERGRWAVKWAAPTEDGGVEYVWVEPVTWSLFRIEGRLASPPQRSLACGRGLDDMVGFPAAELVDWLREPAGAGEREGGFTADVLDRRAAPGR